MTAKPDTEFKIPPQFIDSNFINVADVTRPEVGAKLEGNDLNLNGYHIEGDNHDFTVIRYAFMATMKGKSISGFGGNTKVVARTMAESKLLSIFSPENHTPPNANISFEERSIRKIQGYEEILNKMRANNVLTYFVYDVFELLYGESERPEKFTRKRLIKSTPKLNLRKFASLIVLLLKEKKFASIDFWTFYSLYSRLNDRVNAKIVEPERVISELLSKFRRIEIWSNEKGNIAVISPKKGGEHPHKSLTKRVVDRNGLTNLRNSQKDFLNLYRRYIRAMSSILSFTNCAGNRTRTAKLFAPELRFYFDKSMNEISELKFSFLDTYKSLKSTKPKIDLDSYRLMYDNENLDEDDVIRELAKSSYRYATKYNSKIYSKFFNSTERNNTETTNKDNEISFGQIVDFHIEEAKSVIPMVISGDAGMGKTTVMAQCSLSYFSRLEDKLDRFLSVGEGMPSLPLPVVLKAKRYPSPSLPKFIVDSNPELLKHLSFEEIMQLFETWSSMKDLHNSSMVFFIDGVDECATKKVAKAMFEKVNISSQSSNDNSVLIISTRPSHEDVVSESLPKFSICRMRKGIGEFYSENELSEKMPLMLCDAWGLTRESGEKLSEIFATYQDTLVHPLFVGWFCFLILEGKLEEIEDSSNVVEISQNNLIKTIIEIGVEKSLARRESYISDTIKNNQTTAEEFRKLLEMFVSVAFHYNISKPSKVFTKMQQLGFVKSVSSEIKNSIKNDCGILFLTGNNIEWTHTTIPEIIYADFFFKNDITVNLGPIKVSEPVISRTAQLHYENGEYDSFVESKVNIMHRLFQKRDFSHKIFREYRDEEIKRDFPRGAWEEEGHYPCITVVDGKLTINVNKEISELVTEVCRLFVKSLGTRNQFPIEKTWIDPLCYKEAIDIIYNFSRDVFCEDLIIPQSRNVLDISQLDINKVSGSTKLLDCFIFYRRVLEKYTDRDLSPANPVFKIHNYAGNFEDIFQLSHLIGIDRYLSDDALSWWLERDPPDEWYVERKNLIDYITREYVFTAFEKLFGVGNDETCTDIIYDVLESTTIHLVTDTENGVVNSTNILTWLLGKHGLNGFYYIDTGMPTEILDEYAMNELVERQLVLVPFVYECLELIKKQKAGKGSAPTEFESFVNEFAEQNNGYWEPFELVKAYASNLD